MHVYVRGGWVGGEEVGLGYLILLAFSVGNKCSLYSPYKFIGP